MKEIYYNTVQEFNDYNGFDTLHPLVSVARFDQERTLEESLRTVCAVFEREQRVQTVVWAHRIRLRRNDRHQFCARAADSRGAESRCGISKMDGAGVPPRFAQPHPVGQKHRQIRVF